MMQCLRTPLHPTCDCTSVFYNHLALVNPKLVVKIFFLINQIFNLCCVLKFLCSLLLLTSLSLNFLFLNYIFKKIWQWKSTVIILFVLWNECMFILPWCLNGSSVELKKNLGWQLFEDIILFCYLQLLWLRRWLEVSCLVIQTECHLFPIWLLLPMWFLFLYGCFTLMSLDLDLI